MIYSVGKDPSVIIGAIPSDAVITGGFVAQVVVFHDLAAGVVDLEFHLAILGQAVGDEGRGIEGVRIQGMQLGDLRDPRGRVVAQCVVENAHGAVIAGGAVDLAGLQPVEIGAVLVELGVLIEVGMRLRTVRSRDQGAHDLRRGKLLPGRAHDIVALHRRLGLGLPGEGYIVQGRNGGGEGGQFHGGGGGVVLDGLVHHVKAVEGVAVDDVLDHHRVVLPVDEVDVVILKVVTGDCEPGYRAAGGADAFLVVMDLIVDDLDVGQGIIAFFVKTAQQDAC